MMALSPQPSPPIAPLTIAIASAALAITSFVISSTIRDKLRAERRCQDLEEELAELRKELKPNQPIAANGSISKPPNQSNGNVECDGKSKCADEPLPHDTRKKQPPTIEEETSIDDGLFVKRVGTIRSIYKLCVGTPRQGLLAPNARGYIELEKIGDSSTASSVIGLEGYSHIWIIFVFHLNTKSSNPKRIKSKISPPALGGQKVGLYATRSPHRYNPIGITLCKIDRVEKIPKTKHAPERTVIHISGLDLVDGTPVLDIKPFVPIYDSVPENVRLPSWVEGGLATQRTVLIDESPKDDLKMILEKDKNALRFYGPKYGERSIEETMDYAMECIRQVLAMDVRSNFQTKKARQGKFQAERARRLQRATDQAAADVCTQQLDNLLIEYVVSESSDHKRSSSAGSGAEDTVTVLSVKLLQE